MINFLKSIISIFPPELSHSITINILKMTANFQKKNSYNDLKLHQHIWGLDFNNPVGLAAGFDKNAEAVIPLLNLGFGFVEAGTVTPLPQEGNDKPRVFRLLEDKAIINHLGFNNKGLKIVKKNLKKLNLNNLSNGVVGINIGKNLNSINYIEDYCQCLEKLGPFAHYITINVSSPNTPGLRDLQKSGNIEKLIKSLYKLRDDNEYLTNKPILLKISPDLNDQEIRDIALMSLALNLDGLIISNSTIKRSSKLISINKNERGGLSGKPLFDDSTFLLKKFYNLTNAQVPLIGTGGITNGIDCYEKIKSGACLVQLYTSLIYEGPSVVNKINKDLSSFIEIDGYKNIKEVIGVDT